MHVQYVHEGKLWMLEMLIQSFSDKISTNAYTLYPWWAQISHLKGSAANDDVFIKSMVFIQTSINTYKWFVSTSFSVEDTRAIFFEYKQVLMMSLVCASIVFWWPDSSVCFACVSYFSSYTVKMTGPGQRDNTFAQG